MADSEAAPTAPAAPAAKLYPADAPLTQPELAELLRLLQLVDPKQHAEFFESSHCRPLRKCVMTIAQQQKAKQFGGKPKAEYETTLRRRKEAAGRKAQQAELDRLHVNQGKLRLARLQKLSELQQQPGQAQLPRIADGATQGAEDVGVGGGGLGAAAGGQLQAAGGAAGAAAAREWAADDLEQRSAESAAERAADEEADPDNLEGGRLFRPRACYVCKARYVKLHAFYDLLCPACAEVSAAGAGGVLLLLLLLMLVVLLVVLLVMLLLLLLLLTPLPTAELGEAQPALRAERPRRDRDGRPRQDRLPHGAEAAALGRARGGDHPLPGGCGQAVFGGGGRGGVAGATVGAGAGPARRQRDRALRPLCGAEV